MEKTVDRDLGCWRAVAAGLLLCLWGGIAAGEPREVHKRGVEALEAGRWTDAERFFRAAIAERGEERAGALRGRYLPHYYLGVALAEQGRCRTALAAWAESTRQGKIDKAGELLGDLQRRRGRCQEHLRQVDERKAEVEALLRQVESSQKSLATFATKPQLAPQWSRAAGRGGEGSFAARQERAGERLAAARQRLREGFEGADLATLDQAGELAGEALAGLRSAINDARRELGELSAASTVALGRLEAAAAAAQGTVRSIADLKPYPPELGRRAAAVERLLGSVERRKDEAQADELESLEGELAAAVERLRSAARRPPRTLVSAVEAFLDGRYQEVLELLAEDRFRDRRTRTHICVLRAAARHALWVLGGELEPALRDQASAEAVACDELDPDFELLEKYFSPRFAEFYAAARIPPVSGEPELETGEEAADGQPTSDHPLPGEVTPEDLPIEEPPEL